ncbi:MAG TPA: hypothetical protein VJP88_11050 [Caulobacteraceae bacterium]|nr:hypothetical protein [Caulobacteraceae bacterium]
MAASGGSADALAQAHQALLRQGDLQFDMTVWRPPPVPGWVQLIGQLIKALAPVFPYIFWGGLAIGAVAVLFFLGRELIAMRLPRWKRQLKAAPGPPEWRPSEARARTLLEDADRLAAQGRYGEAAHLILFRSIEDIDERWPNLVRPSLTSRDIARHAGLPERAKSAFGYIARLVETSFFGAAALDADDFAACRSIYEGFALPGTDR